MIKKKNIFVTPNNTILKWKKFKSNTYFSKFNWVKSFQLLLSRTKTIKLKDLSQIIFGWWIKMFLCWMMCLQKITFEWIAKNLKNKNSEADICSKWILNVIFYACNMKWNENLNFIFLLFLPFISLENNQYHLWAYTMSSRMKLISLKWEKITHFMT